MALPTLYCKSKTGKTQVWNIETIGATIRVSYGYEDGAVTVKEKTIESGKNLGKKNATTPAEQAAAEAKSAWDKKKTGGYAESLDDAHVPAVADAGAVAAHVALLPMLAHDYHKRGKDIKFPCYVQPKLDGVRCIFRDGVLTSRQGKVFPDMEHITTDLAGVDLILDGELYSETLNFQEFVGLVRKKKHNAAEKVMLQQVKYWVYDCVNEKPFADRFNDVYQLFNGQRTFEHVRRLATVQCERKEELKGFHDRFVAEGSEGLIIRNAAGLYQLAARSKDLQKYKEFMDDEFVVTGYTDGEGSEKGLVIWICETTDKKTFHVRPRGTHEERGALFDKYADDFVGKKLTVRYQELTDDGIPRFPVGIAFRDYE